jgi:redox-sensitive bicupin YhaK (pirin superfamily)
MLQGAVDHEDFVGNAGTIEAGDLQFMTAGKGIMHAEMPRTSSDGTLTIGMQLWVDLPEKLKKCEPRYRDLKASEIPKIDIDDGKVHVKIISGQSHGVDSVQELAYTPVWIFDVEIKPGGKIIQNLPVGWNAFAYTLGGSTAFGTGKDKTVVGQYHNVVFEQKGDEVNAEVEEGAKENGRFSKSCDFIPFRFNFPKRRDPPTHWPSSAEPNRTHKVFWQKRKKEKEKGNSLRLYNSIQFK